MAERGRAESAERERAMGQRQDQHLDRMRRARDDVATSEAKKKSEVGLPTGSVLDYVKLVNFILILFYAFFRLDVCL
jgi:hypothetical protein